MDGFGNQHLCEEFDCVRPIPLSHLTRIHLRADSSEWRSWKSKNNQVSAVKHICRKICGNSRLSTSMVPIESLTAVS